MKEGIIAGGGVEESDPKLDPFVEQDSVPRHELRRCRRLRRAEEDAGRDRQRSSAPAAIASSISPPRRSTSPTSSTSSASTAWRSPATPRDGKKTWVRIIIEKPFGHDLESARALNDEVNKVFDEDQIFRIDHYLGKETVQNILVFRFANGIFENVWNRNYIDHVEITAAESHRHRRPRAVLRDGRRAARRGAEPRDGAAQLRGHGAARLLRGRLPCAPRR